MRTKVHLCVLTLGYSRRQVVRVFRQQWQRHWLQALEEAFRDQQVLSLFQYYNLQPPGLWLK